MAKICANEDFQTSLEDAISKNPGSMTGDSPTERVSHYKTYLIVKLVIIFLGYILAFGALSFVYFILLNRFNHEMESFHLFLTTYR